MTEPVLCLNTGSSSLRAAGRDPALRWSVHVERLHTADASATVSAPPRPERTEPVRDGIAGALDLVRRTVADTQPAAVAHRVVHGGTRFTGPVPIDAEVLDELRRLIPLAPLHLPPALDTIERAQHIWPDAVHVACFDTAFHRDLPDEAVRLPLPEDVVDLGVRRYGFHGLALQSIVDRTVDLGPAVMAHLGGGCSVTAVVDGRSRHTTMSLTPAGGVVSATRTGDLDPEVMLFLRAQGWDDDRLRALVNSGAGFAAVAGGRSDMRDLLSARSGGDEAADLAIRVFTRSVAQAVASCAVALDRWDTLVFSGGIGEHSGAIRDEICERLRPVRGSADLDVRVVEVDEEAVMDGETRQVLAW